MPSMSSLGKEKHVDYEFNASLVYIERCRLVRAAQQDCLKQQNKTTKTNY